MKAVDYLSRWLKEAQRELDRRPLTVRAVAAATASDEPTGEEQADALRRIAREARWRAWLGG